MLWPSSRLGEKLVPDVRKFQFSRSLAEGLLYIVTKREEHAQDGFGDHERSALRRRDRHGRDASSRRQRWPNSSTSCQVTRVSNPANISLRTAWRKRHPPSWSFVNLPVPSEAFEFAPLLAVSIPCNLTPRLLSWLHLLVLRINPKKVLLPSTILPRLLRSRISRPHPFRRHCPVKPG
jgi:hypothetical protein